MKIINSKNNKPLTIFPTSNRAPLPLTIKENHAIKVGLIRRPTFIWKGYISRPLAPGEHTSSTESKLGFQLFIQVDRIPLVHLVLVLVHLVLVLVSSSCNLENRERERERRGERRMSRICRIFLNIVLLQQLVRSSLFSKFFNS